ncbi:choice-of-anchor B family protein [Polaribacter butkevichii]|uniref:Choice-of-anchor B family protein n=1 Tax=Polaribacter butkevichii TaxID=218490 RepID=A0A2P6C7E9_9FLAO|nr:choice-of-anchor B family protein [Polaribacter butkevichii]PQJ68858.1 hypothetical protein BTO14_12490 [Polaribacter butkevichii]
MFKNIFFLVLISLIYSCTKKDVFDRENQVIINPIAKCENGLAGEYPCNDYDLLTHFSLEDIGGTDTTISTCWGWSDTETKKEFALVGTNKGVTFIEITNPADAKILGTLKTTGTRILDIKRYQSFAFIVNNDATNNLQIFNLEQLRNVGTTPTDFISHKEGVYNDNPQSIAINEESNFIYFLGSKNNKGGPIFYNISVVPEPKFKGSYQENSYDNPAKVVTYNGPDAAYIGQEILIGSNEDELVILNVTDKENPVKIATISYVNSSKTTKASFTEDYKYVIIGDESDAQNKTVILDVSDLDNPVHHLDFEGTTTAIDHAGFVKNDKYYQANTTAGLRVLDLSDIENKIVTESGFFDTYPENDTQETKGALNVFPNLSSGNILITDTEKGFFVVRKSKS